MSPTYRCITAHIAHDTQLAIWDCETVHVDKLWYLLIQVDAIYEDVAVSYLLERATFGSFLHVPSQDMIGRYANLLAKLHRAFPATA